MRTPSTESERHELRRNGLSTSDVATRLGVSMTQVYQYVDDGELAAWDAAKKGAKRRDYRFSEADVAKFEQSRMINAGKSAA